MLMGIDIGTTSISIVVFDSIRRRVAEVINVKNDFCVDDTRPYRYAQDPTKIAATVLQLCNTLFTRYHVIKIGVTGQMHGILYVDGDGEPVSRLYTWQDESGENICRGNQSYREYINETTGYDLVKGIAFGCVTHFYLQQNNEIAKNAARLCTIGDFIVMRLCRNREPVMHISNAAGLGLYRLADRRFDWEAMEKLSMDVSYFPCIESGYAVAGHTEENIPVAVAIGDNQASFLGSVVDMEGEVLLNLGTGGQISCFSKEVVTGACIETRPLAGSDFLVVSTVHCGGRAYAALEHFFRSVVAMAGFDAGPLYDAMERSIGNYRQSKEDIMVNTAFCGSRSNPMQRGEISNITLRNFTPENLVHGFLRGIAAELHPVFLEFAKSRHFCKLTASGNTIRKNQAFQKILKELYGLPLQLTEFPEEAACGAAFFAEKTEPL